MQPPPLTADDVTGFLTERAPAEWVALPPTVTIDSDEVLIVLYLDDGGDRDGGTGGHQVIDEFREATRAQRMDIAGEAEHRWRRKVAWGARSGDLGVVFTHLSIPAMTRLRIQERIVLDTLIDAGVARSRSDALAWCVRLVGSNLDEWLGELRDALVKVDEVRRRGPAA